MQLLTVNDVVQTWDRGQTRLERCLAADSAEVVLLELETARLNLRVLSREACDDLLGRRVLTVKDSDPLLEAAVTIAAALTEGAAALSPASIARGQKAWTAISGIVGLPDIFEQSARVKHERQVAAEHGVRIATVRTWIREYWQSGMVPAGLMGRYWRCSRRGSRKPGTQKTGRPPKPGSPVGINVTDQMERHTPILEALCRQEGQPPHDSPGPSNPPRREVHGRERRASC